MVQQVWKSPDCHFMYLIEFIKQNNGASVKHIYPRGDILNQPIKSLQQTFSSVCTTAHNFPVPCLVHSFQVKYLTHTMIKKNHQDNKKRGVEILQLQILISASVVYGQ